MDNAEVEEFTLVIWVKDTDGSLIDGLKLNITSKTLAVLFFN